MVHFSIFFIFHCLPDFGNGKDNFLISLTCCLIDSFSKSRSISNSIKITLSAGKNNFITTFLISVLYNQLGKYLFERLLMNSRNNSFYKNWAILVSIGLLSMQLIDINLQEYVYSISLIIFVGSRLDIWFAQKYKVRPRKQGRSKLVANAETRSLLS